MIDDLLQKVRRASRVHSLSALITLQTNRFWEAVLSFVFNYPSRCYHKMRDGETRKIVGKCPALKYFSDHFGIYSHSRSMIGKVTREKEDIEIASRLLETIYHKLEDPFLVDVATAEVLAKVMAYRQLEQGDFINIPVQNACGKIELITYEVDHTFDLWQKVVAFGLRPTKGPPILLFRGTEFNVITKRGRATILSDLDPRGPGHALFLNARPAIAAWLKTVSENGPKARVYGHSLGGALASYTAIYEFDLINKEPNALSYAFNPPGIDPDVIALWNEIPADKKPELVTYVVRGDFVSKFGELFGSVYELSSPKPLSPLVAHQTLLFSQPICSIQAVDTTQENRSRSRLYYSRVQRQTTSFAYRFGLKHLLPNPYD